MDLEAKMHWIDPAKVCGGGGKRGGTGPDEETRGRAQGIWHPSVSQTPVRTIARWMCRLGWAQSSHSTQLC